MAREKIKRYFDTDTLCHYYYNTVYGTTSWRKPYCLRQEELFPFLDPESAACRMQGLYRMRKARHRTIGEILNQFQKIFDRRTGRFYFAYIGAGTLIRRQSWYPPLLLSRRGYFGTIPLVYTNDVAALVIQRKWRAVLIRQFLKAVVRDTYDRQWDPVRGQWKYVNLDDGSELHYKPLCLRGDHWDPKEIPEWSVYEVCVFFRRLGYRDYVKDLKTFKVDGRTLLLLDTQDYANINITDKIHIRKIQVEIDRLWPPWKRESINSLHLIRRAKLKRQGELEAAVLTIQRVYRGHLGRIDAQNAREVIRVLAEKRMFNREIEDSAVWWLQTVATQNHETYKPPRQPVGTVAPPPEYKLPPLKTFGRKRTHLSCDGWGRFDSRDGWQPMREDFNDQHITNQFTQRLQRTGYDRRRAEQRETMKFLQVKKREVSQDDLW